MFHRTRTRVVATVATLALLGGVGFVALSPAAQAASACVAGKPITCVGSLASTTGPTTIFPGVTNQPGGDWTTAPLEASARPRTPSPGRCSSRSMTSTRPSRPA